MTLRDQNLHVYGAKQKNLKNYVTDSCDGCKTKDITSGVFKNRLYHEDIRPEKD